MSTQSVLNDAEELELARLRLHALSLASLLNHSKLRSILSSSLNHLQLITTDTGNARDYRGLAELYHFEYSDVQKLSRADNPIIQLLTNVDVQTRKQQFQNGDSVGQPTPRSSIATLIRNLCSIERFDVMDDLLHELRTLQLTENEKMSMCKILETKSNKISWIVLKINS